MSYAKSDTTLLGYSYGASGSNDGLISSITDSVQSGRTVSYTYDSLGRLSTALTSGSSTYPQWGLKWTYDRYANRTQQAITAGTGPSNLVTVSATTNKITGSPYAYDTSGNMTNDGFNTLVYDCENRATSATNGGSSGAYTYDGKGLRLKKCVASCPSGSTGYIFSGSKVIAEYSSTASASSPTIEYVYAGATLIASEDNTSTYRFYQRDHLSNRVVTSSWLGFAVRAFYWRSSSLRAWLARGRFQFQAGRQLLMDAVAVGRSLCGQRQTRLAVLGGVQNTRAPTLPYEVGTSPP